MCAGYQPIGQTPPYQSVGDQVVPCAGQKEHRSPRDATSYGHGRHHGKDDPGGRDWGCWGETFQWSPYGVLGYICRNMQVCSMADEKENKFGIFSWVGHWFRPKHATKASGSSLEGPGLGGGLDTLGPNSATVRDKSLTYGRPSRGWFLRYSVRAVDLHLRRESNHCYPTMINWSIKLCFGCEYECFSPKLSCLDPLLRIPYLIGERANIHRKHILLMELRIRFKSRISEAKYSLSSDTGAPFTTELVSKGTSPYQGSTSGVIFMLIGGMK